MLGFLSVLVQIGPFVGFRGIILILFLQNFLSAQNILMYDLYSITTFLALSLFSIRGPRTLKFLQGSASEIDRHHSILRFFRPPATKAEGKQERREIGVPWQIGYRTSASGRR